MAAIPAPVVHEFSGGVQQRAESVVCWMWVALYFSSGDVVAAAGYLLHNVSLRSVQYVIYSTYSDHSKHQQKNSVYNNKVPVTCTVS